MNYKSTKEIATLWSISSRRVNILASTGRIPGAKLVGKTWLIPEDAIKPSDARYKNNNIEKYFFPLPIFIYDSFETAEKKLSKTQLELYKAQQLCVCGNFKEADILFTNLLKSTDNLYIKLGVLYFKIYTDVFFSNYESIFKTNTLIHQIDLSQYEKKEELSLIILDMNGIINGNKIYIENFQINQNNNYSTDFLPYLMLIETYTSLITAFTSGEKAKPVFTESACIFMKQNNYVYGEISLHLYLGMMYKIDNDFENYYCHVQKALQLAEKYEILLPFVISFKFLQKEIMDYLSKCSSSAFQKLPEIAKTFHNNADKFLQSINTTKIYFNLKSDELELIEAARSGLTNKEIAKLKDISESYVSKKYFQLCKKTGVTSKKQLVDLFIENMKM